MPITPIDVGTAANNDTGDPLRMAFQKSNSNDEFLKGQIDLKENALGNPISDDMYLVSTIAGVRSWKAPEASGGGVTQTYVDDADAATLQAALNADLDLGTTAGTAAAGNDSRILNGQTAYEKRITGISITGTSTKTVTITLADSTTITGSFVDDGSGGGTSDGNDYVTGGSFNISTGVITLTRTDGGTVTFPLDGRYEPIFTKNTGFNKSFGATAGTVAEGNHTHTFASLTSKPNTLSGFGITDGEKKRTTKVVTNTTQYTLIAADSTDFNLQFSANAGETISVILNSGVAPAVGAVQMISSGNNFLELTLGTGVTVIKPENTTFKSRGKGEWLGLMKLESSNAFSLNGGLESTETAGETYTVFSSTENGLVPTPNETGSTKFLRQDGSWVVPEGGTGGGETYGVFTNTEDGLVPAPNVSGGTAYDITIDSPTEGQEFTEGDIITVTGTVTETVGSATKKVLKSTGWEDEDSLGNHTHKREEKYILGNTTPNYTLQLEDKDKFLSIRLADVNITIPSGVFANGDVIKGFCNSGYIYLSSDLGYTAFPAGATNKCIGYFEIRISSSSSTTVNANNGIVTGEFVQEFNYLKSPNRTMFEIKVSDTGVLTATDNGVNF